MSDISQELLKITEEANALRREKNTRKRRWPAEFKEKVVALVDSGGRVGEIAKTTGIAAWTIYAWQKKKSVGISKKSFSELKVVKARRSPLGSINPIILKSPQGFSLTLSYSILRSLLKEGLL